VARNDAGNQEGEFLLRETGEYGDSCEGSSMTDGCVGHATILADVSKKKGVRQASRPLSRERPAPA